MAAAEYKKIFCRSYFFMSFGLLGALKFFVPLADSKVEGEALFDRREQNRAITDEMFR